MRYRAPHVLFHFESGRNKGVKEKRAVTPFGFLPFRLLGRFFAAGLILLREIGSFNTQKAVLDGITEI